MDRLFLDANVLFSAAYRSDAGLRRLWDIGVVLTTSTHAVQEARRNLDTPGQQARLDAVLKEVTIVSEVLLPPSLVESVELPDKDIPIVAGALAAGATHLVTGDARHLGRHFGRGLHGVLVVTPAQYLRGHASEGAS